MVAQWTGRQGIVAVLGIGAGLLLAACQAEQRPTGGSIKTIGSPTTGSVSGVSGSVSGVTGSVSGPAAASPSPAASPEAAMAGDGIYEPVSNVASHAAISQDVADIGELTNAVQEGQPLPQEEILEIYEQGRHSQGSSGPRTLRGFARDPQRAEQFPEATAYYNSPTFLDDSVYEAIQGTGSAAESSPAERRQAINKGLQRILAYWIRHELITAGDKVQAGETDPQTGAPHNIDEAWAFYMGVPDGGEYPYALSATAQSREENFNRQGMVDEPLRQALARAQQAAMAGNQSEYQAAADEALSQLNALFYLATVRYLNESVQSAQAGETDQAATQLAEGLAFYQTIQPQVAQADAAADETITNYLRSDPASLTIEQRDAAIEALNSAADALGLEQSDLVQPSDLG